MVRSHLLDLQVYTQIGICDVLFREVRGFFEKED